MGKKKPPKKVPVYTSQHPLAPSTSSQTSHGSATAAATSSSSNAVRSAPPESFSPDREFLETRRHNPVSTPGDTLEEFDKRVEESNNPFCAGGGGDSTRTDDHGRYISNGKGRQSPASDTGIGQSALNRGFGDDLMYVVSGMETVFISFSFN